ncbi:MAG: HipA domain-containing protein [Opitutales bacterium]|nr:HipA domain-containing protein [Opitutales bacterium]
MAEQVLRQKVTVPGVQPKLSLHLEKTKLNQPARFTLVALDGGFILKPPVERFPEMPELEHVTMRMARCFGLSTAECGLIPMEGGQHCFITRRMDREGTTKLHMEDMCQLTDRLTEEKYRGSLEQVGKIILRHCQNPLFDALRFFELTLFCFLTGNADMHLKNFSLLYPLGGEIQLSPAYDLVPTVLLLPEDQAETALTLNGRKRRLQQRDFAAFGEALKLSPKQIQNTYTRFANSLPSALEELARSFCSAEKKQAYANLIHTRAERLGLNAK